MADSPRELAEVVRVLDARLRFAERMGWRYVTVEVPELRAVVAEAEGQLEREQNRME